MKYMEVDPGEHISDACWKLYKEVYEDDEPHVMEFNGLFVLMIPTKDWFKNSNQMQKTNQKET